MQLLRSQGRSFWTVGNLKLLLLLLIILLAACSGGGTLTVPGGGDNDDEEDTVQLPALPKCIEIREPTLSFDAEAQRWYHVADRTNLRITWRWYFLDGKDYTQTWETMKIRFLDRQGNVLMENFLHELVMNFQFNIVDGHYVETTANFADLTNQGFGDERYTFTAVYTCGKTADPEIQGETGEFTEELSLDILFD